MKKEEWLAIGYQNNLIDIEEMEKIMFKEIYKQWFAMKCKSNRSSTMDRIEVTWNKYYANSDFIEKCISNITESDIISFFQKIIVSHGNITSKEFTRIFQIVSNVLIYAKDMQMLGARLYDWELIKRNVPRTQFLKKHKNENALSNETVQKIMDSVIKDNIYFEKQSACLCLCLNFYLGLRVGELAALQFSDFDIKEKLVYITRTDSKFYERDENGDKTQLCYVQGDTKTHAGMRKIPLTCEALYIYELIKAHHSISGYHSPFLVYDGKDSIRLRSLDRTLKRLCVLIGIPDFNTHLIRKTFASKLHYANVPTRVVSTLMGHTEMTTTERNYILNLEKESYGDYMKRGLNYHVRNFND